MSEQIRDAIRHLEHDLAEVLPILMDKQTTEVILNPYKNHLGVYEGHILVDQHGIGLHNMFMHKELIFENLVLNLTDKVLCKRDLSGDLSYCQKIVYDNLSNLEIITQVIKGYWQTKRQVRMAYQSEFFNIIEFANQIADGYFNFKKIDDTLLANLTDLVEQINQELFKNYQFKLTIEEINSKNIALFKQYHPQKLITSEFIKMSATKAETIMSVLASITGKFIHNKNPYLECQIPKYGYRFTGVIPPASVFPAFCIRKHSSKIYTLDDFVSQGILTITSKATIISWIKRKFNILIAGGTGSGKTTLANAILYEISRLFPETRMLIIEDVPELQFNTSRSIAFTVGDFFQMTHALRTTLRFKPDRIIMGEVRGAEAYTLLKAWNTGHPGGVATIHANGVTEALFRFESCLRDNLEAKVNRQEIGFTINGIIAIQNITVKENINGELCNTVKRKVTALRQIIQYDMSKDIYQDVIFDRLEEGFDE